MLQKTDEDRRSAVLTVLQERKIRFPVTEIHKATGLDKGMISNYLNGKKPISDKFYSTFMEKIGGEKGGGSLSEGQLAAHIIRVDARTTVTLEVLAELLAAQRGLPVGAILKALEEQSKAKERLLQAGYE